MYAMEMLWLYTIFLRSHVDKGEMKGRVLYRVKKHITSRAARPDLLEVFSFILPNPTIRTTQ